MKWTCSEDHGNKYDVKDIKNEEKSAKIQMYKPTLLNFFPSISSQLQTLGDKKKNKFSYGRVLKEAVSLKAVHSISRQKSFPSFFVGEEALVSIY